MNTVRRKIRRHQSKATIALLYHYLPKKVQEKYFSKEHAQVDADTNQTVRVLRRLFIRRGFKVQLITVKPDDLYNLKKLKADFVFNLVDSKAMELQIAKILDRLKIPHSGPGFQAIQNSNNKLRSKLIFQKHALPTPEFSIIRPSDRIVRSLVPSKFPVIVKPAFEHCSIGITENSISLNYKQFKTTVQRLRNKYHQTLIAERFIKGKELQVTVLEKANETVALPIAEIAFRGKVKNKWNIYGFDEKWGKHLPIYKSCHFVAPPRKLQLKIDMLIKRDAIRAFYALELRDYARFDLRYNPRERKWYFLEGNANAGFSENADDAMTASILAHGMTFEDFVLQIVKNSLRV